MSEECVVAVYENVARAKSAIGELIASGYPQKNISLVTASMEGEPAAVKKRWNLGTRRKKTPPLERASVRWLDCWAELRSYRWPAWAW